MIDLVSANTLFYFGSAVAQSIVALLGFGALIGFSRRDSVWSLVFPEVVGTLIKLSQRMEGYTFWQDPEPPTTQVSAQQYFSDRGHGHLLAEALERRTEYARSTDQGVALRAAADVGSLFRAVPVDRDLSRSQNDPTSGEWYLHELRRHGATVIQAEGVWSDLTNSMVAMIHAGIPTAMLALLLVIIAEAATTPGAPPFFRFAGLAVFALATAGTLLTFVEAVKLAKACLASVRVME